jgi:hypothetical protein
MNINGFTDAKLKYLMKSESHRFDLQYFDQEVKKDKY